ncbi:type VI secretion system accessory protein TagJ [Pseudorhodoferax sp. Leaf274]|uniref:type VI secretion system accessory protein TagJ n=1 Tax=Pseudorhodoferax sp. Leaf274 TaxID=1736318 RepID=UPI00070390D3|nr:type VI secretion system accessory protein TagJ [Pseudorhodoferax sp. Leaf274]KQP35440.1 virulence protein SciE type [Pseudorhodoferax sp. Leaf274]
MNQEALAAAEAAVRASDPKAALAALTTAVKAAPANPKLRIFMAQLLCVLGQWERAHTQLNVVADMDSTAGPMREMVGHALRCELLRAAVFDGRRTPMVFGQPDEWLALLIESMLQRKDAAQSAHLAAAAFDAAPATAGLLNGEPFEWIADADSRLGPVLEAMVNGKYYWIPFSRLSRISIDDPGDLRDRVWLPAHIGFANGGEAIAMVPTRYPGSEKSEDGQILMAARTEWAAIGDERYAGLGQRVLVTDTGEHDMLSVRLIEFHDAAAAPGANAGAQADG